MTVLLAVKPSEAATGKKRSPTTRTVVTRLVVGQLSPQPLKQRRLRLFGRANLPALRAVDLPQPGCLFGASNNLALTQLPPDLVADLARQLLQIDQGPRVGQFLLMFPGQLLHNPLDLGI